MSSPRRILISGSTGFIGRAVVARRRELGDVVVPLVRREGSAGSVHWNPGSETLDPQFVSGFDTVVHLAGEPVVGFWTAKKRQRIFDSRVKGTAELVEALAAAPRPPRRFLCASGINFYGNRGDLLLTEDARKGTGFLAKYVRAGSGHRNRLQGFRTSRT
jgi:NAD dependent epimerase/dehydratase family enzyme